MRVVGHAAPPEAETVSLLVRPAPGVLAIFRLMSETEIDFDLRELQGQEGVGTLCDFLRAIGSELGKPVLMTSKVKAKNTPSSSQGKRFAPHRRRRFPRLSRP